MAGFLPPTPQIQVDTNVWAVKYWFDKMQKWAKGTSQVKPIIVTASYTITPDESFYGYIVDTTAGSVILTLPPAAGAVGKKFFIKMRVTNATCIVTPFTGDTIDGNTTIVLVTANDWIEIVSDGVNKWWIVSRNNRDLVQIASVTAPGGTNQITISSIPSTYRDLIITFYGRSDSTVAADIGIYLQLNGDTTAANYTNTITLTANGAATSSTSIAPTGNGGSILYGPGLLSATAVIASGEILIPGYSNVGFNFKAVQSLAYERSAISSFVVTNKGFTWQSFAAAINQLRFTIASGNFAAGSTFVVYGRGY